MKQFLFFLTVLFLGNTLPIEDQPRRNKDFALFFAIDDYGESQAFGELKNPVRDARAIAEELSKMYNFKTEVYENPTKEKIFATLAEWQQRSFTKNAQLFVFFSGHGTFREFTKKGYLVPSGVGQTEFDEMIELTDLGNIITQIKCDHILLAVDACYSGTMDTEIAFKGRPVKDENGKLEQIVKKQLRNSSRLLLTSGEKERTPDGDEHSPFTDGILKGLRAGYTFWGGLITYPTCSVRCNE